MKTYITYTAEEGKVLYYDFPNEGRRFTTTISLPATAEPWKICTLEDMEAWFEEHPEDRLD